jgi:hypothetical protein
VRPAVVIDVPPAIEGALALIEIGQTIERDLGLPEPPAASATPRMR